MKYDKSVLNPTLPISGDNHILSKSEKGYHIIPIEIATPYSCNPVFGDSTSSNEEYSILQDLSDRQIMSEDYKYRPQMAFSNTSKGELNKEIPKSAHYMATK
ncbi:hypothetical protein AOL_s00088g60 [Orbilia oligospora ATCC 24927]|uniref:Uncharacterized protein n=1 Tax=Arthrobotrys oligospora (strain ATCC 24927 / CBS 115.81 / DSM 1491) TaxID=756982 RepID=G1XHU7_ARTOA|nr:hypothetical protein AOL_s00088g60 [Orbilia oligospora ATCC 24927]EGX47284.1 hypothetical protein AOL_s00088g60 [Orbilia oligospora ATCC 24927]